MKDGRFIEKVFTRTDTSDFVGLVRCRAEVEFTEGSGGAGCPGNGIFTTLPVVPSGREDLSAIEGDPDRLGYSLASGLF